jgi:hypothetical protein
LFTDENCQLSKDWNLDDSASTPNIYWLSGVLDGEPVLLDSIIEQASEGELTSAPTPQNEGENQHVIS